MATKAKNNTDHSSKTTRDHDEIRQWVEERNGVPAFVEGTQILRIDFKQNGPEESLEEVSWEEFFEVFDDRDLVFLYQEETSSGGESRFFKFVSQETAKEAQGS